jgi:FtsZ-interacting cell division protein ZipA
MNLFRPLLAQNILPTDVIPGASHWMGLTLKELLILLGAVTIVTLFLVVWAVYLRKTPHQHSHRHYSYPEGDQQNKSSSVTESEDLDEKRYRRKRRRRREHRPRNPTLAETGGLPPLRSEHPQDPLP